MSFRKAVTTAAAIAMIAMPALAQAANTASPVSRLSLSAASATVAPGARVGAVSKRSSKMGGSSTILLVLAGLAVAAGVAVAVSGGDSSP